MHAHHVELRFGNGVANGIAVVDENQKLRDSRGRRTRTGLFPRIVEQLLLVEEEDGVC